MAKKIKDKERDSIDFGKSKIEPLFNSIFYPTLFSMVFASLFTVADGIFVGQGVGSNALAAINIVSPLFLVTTGLALMFGVGRVGWKSLKDNVALLWGMDSRSLGYTLFQLLTRPGYLVRDYISGRRQVSFPPVKMLVIVSLFAVIIETVFHQNNEVVPIQINIPEIDNVIKWLNDNKSWGTLFLSSFLIFPTWIVFRFAPGYPRHTLPEGFFLQVFLSVQTLLLGLLDYLCEDVEAILGIIYMVITYRQLFGYGWWGTLWRCVVSFLAVLLMLLPLVMIGLLNDEKEVNVTLGVDDREISLMEAGPVLIAIVAIPIAVVLFVTYRISLNTYKKTQLEQ